jgi:hypothetical protein
MRVAAKW